MNALRRLHTEQQQSSWLDDLTREQLINGELCRLAARGTRGVTSNPSTFARAVARSSRYDTQLAELLAAGAGLDEAYWAMAVTDVEAALTVLAPVHHASDGEDGFVSLELDPVLADDTAATVAAAQRILGRPFNAAVVRLMGTQLLTVRVDLDPAPYDADRRFDAVTPVEKGPTS